MELPPAAAACEGAAALAGRASVDGMLAGHAFAATLERDGQGGHWLKVPAGLREAAGVAVGDEVELSIAPAAGEPEPPLPDDLRDALAAAPAARVQWSSLTRKARRDFIHWLDSAKKDGTRRRRIANACDMLEQGKRRICCFDRSGMYGGNAAAPTAAD